MQVEFVRFYERQKYRNVSVFKCHCGLLFTCRDDSVRDGLTKSCGCLRAKNASNLWRNNETKKNR